MTRYMLKFCIDERCRYVMHRVSCVQFAVLRLAGGVWHSRGGGDLCACAIVSVVVFRL